MPSPFHPATRWAVAGGVLLAASATLLVRFDIDNRRAAFQNDARTAHRLLGQRAAQHDAILSTLVLLDGATVADDAAQRLPALHPQVLAVWRRKPGQTWPNPALAQAEATSREARWPVLAAVDAQAAHYDLVLAGHPVSYALRIELERWVPGSDWPFDRAGTVAGTLTLGDTVLTLQPGAAPSVWRGGITPGFVFAKPLDTPSQPFVLRLQRPTGPADWPWARLAAAALALAVLSMAGMAWQRQRQARQRAEQLLRLARGARLNALGELAAGMAHELNQPLTAVLASTQAARRLLDDEPLPRSTLQEALGHASQQARRAADVVARLRRSIQRADAAVDLQDLSLADAVQGALALLQPEMQRLGLRPQLHGGDVRVRADRVALDQILHNLLNNALQAMAGVPAAQRQMVVSIEARDAQGRLSLRDGGPGLPPQVLEHLFEPFNSTRADGLGLGLSLCGSLATAMGGSLSAENVSPHGAAFHLALPLASP